MQTIGVQCPVGAFWFNHSISDTISEKSQQLGTRHSDAAGLQYQHGTWGGELERSGMQSQSGQYSKLEVYTRACLKKTIWTQTSTYLFLQQGHKMFSEKCYALI